MSEVTEEIFRPDLFTQDASGVVRLVGGHCRDCGYYTFPKYLACPKCFSDNIEDKPLSPVGKLHAYTIVRRSMPEYPVPYGLALVDFPENVRVMAQVAPEHMEGIKTGMDMGVTIGPIRKGKDGKVIKSYKFYPVKK
ncbi:MAG: OB-fold domain-containing protein [Candidatus Methanosuratincola sp.]